MRRLYVKSVVDLPNTKEAYTPAIIKTWEALQAPKAPPHWTTVFRWKNRYLNSGDDILALVDNTKNKGNRTSRYPVEVVELVDKAIENRYLQLERHTIQETLDYATTLVATENRLRPQSAQLPLPTRRLITSRTEAIPAFDRYAARHGRSAAVKRFRSLLRHRITSTPLERAEIDHTPLDLMVIDDESGLPLGRPYITACIDDHTRCLLGLYISFEPPSHFTVSRCLIHAFMPKTELKEKYPAIRNQWQAHGVMRELVVDNGPEFHSTSLENACYSLGIEIHYSARKTPWFKGKVERFLGTLNRSIAHGTPGSTFSNIFDKEDYSPDKFAVVRYDTLKEIANTWVTDVYHQKVHRSLGVPPDVMWARSIRPEDILIPDDPTHLGFILGRSEKRVLSHKGIEVYGLHYNSPELTALRRKLGDKLDVEVRIDTSNLGHIVVLSPKTQEPIKAPALQFEYANGLSEWQHRVCKQFAAREMKNYSPRGWLEAKERIRELIDRDFMHRKQRTRAKIARYRNNDASVEASGSLLSNDANANGSDFANPSPMAPDAAIPLTSFDIAEDKPAPRSRRITPLFRERTHSEIAAEQSDRVNTNHD
ncbi:Mu transposase C-terminal domain-containing protein [Niveibacterium microcysteis]|uniref:DDE-type integrase/transposase/recombinase n=1 Tax=Niveibacterium microcysteis TaxID=2811415 RepID=A0ABX7M1Z5_9RHOO|nr:Mu transposase C-terminal domain-containing protein [Niveibacterium microcysteis]QSI75359.1 DDE-type integrase/transposase/recombinase [Niveibacterium microcysteis]